MHTNEVKALPLDGDQSSQLAPLRETRCGAVPSAPFFNVGLSGAHAM